MNTILQKRIEEAAEQYAYTNWGNNDYHERAEEGMPFDPIGYLEKCFKEAANFTLQNQWISVEEALPEKNIMCLVRKETEVGIIYDTDYIDYEGKWFFNFNRASIKSKAITHWMSIPELKGDEK